MIGLFTRISAFILSGEMAFAYFLGHMLKTGAPVLLPLNNGGTAAILFCFACLYLATAGGGPLSVDAAIGDAAQTPCIPRHAQFTRRRGMTPRLSPAPSIPAAPRPRIWNCAAPARS